MHPMLPPCVFIHSAIGLPFIVCINREFLPVQSKTSEMCQHVTGSRRCPSVHKSLPVFAFTQCPQPQPTSFHPRFHLLLLPTFSLSLPLSHHPGSHAPLCGLVWPFLPPFTHTYTLLSLSPTTRTDWTSHVHSMKANVRHLWYNCKWGALSFVHRDKLVGGHNT